MQKPTASFLGSPGRPAIHPQVETEAFIFIIPQLVGQKEGVWREGEAIVLFVVRGH